MDTFLGAPVMVGGEPFGNIYVTEKAGGGDFSDDDEEALVWLAAFAGLAIDHANRYTQSEASRSDLQRTVDALDASIQIARAHSAPRPMWTPFWRSWPSPGAPWWGRGCC